MYRDFGHLGAEEKSAQTVKNRISLPHLSMAPFSFRFAQLFMTLSASSFLSGCHHGAAPPGPAYPSDGGPPTIRVHCSVAADLGAARAHRWEVIRGIGLGGSISAVASLPMIQASDDRNTRIGLGAALSVAALAAATTAVHGDRRARHHRAMAVGYAACADMGDEQVAQLIAGEMYRLSVRSSVNAADVAAVLGRVLRDPNGALPMEQGPMGPPPPPPTSHQPLGPHGPRDVLRVANPPLQL